MANFIYSQLFVRPTYPTRDFSGETVIVTGSNVGLGLEGARHFVRLNAAKVILAVRNIKSGEEAKSNIEASTKRTGVVEVWKLDLGSYDSVKQFAKRATDELDHVDHLVENAGISTADFRLVEKDESTVTVNVISTFLLALLMLPKLQATARKLNVKPTLTIVTSEVHAWTKFPERSSNSILKDLSDPNTPTMNERYMTSKLLEVLIIRQIAPMISDSKNSSVVLNMLNPGLCHSSLAREDDGWTFKLMKAVLARTTEVGSRTLVASASAGPESHGKYMSDAKVEDHSLAEWVRQEEGDQVGKKLWKEVGERLESIQPGILSNLS